MSLIDKLRRKKTPQVDDSYTSPTEDDGFNDITDFTSSEDMYETADILEATDGEKSKAAKKKAVSPEAIFKKKKKHKLKKTSQKKRDIPKVSRRSLAPRTALCAVLGSAFIIIGIACFFLWRIFVPAIEPITVDINQKKLTAHNGKLVHMQGKLSGDTILKDPVFKVEEPYGLGLERIVETYQWSEDGKEKLWSQDLITPPRGYRNPQKKYFASEKFTPEKIYIGGLELNESLIKKQAPFTFTKRVLTQEDYNNLPEKGKRAFRLLEDGSLIWTDNPLSPKIGSVRISFNTITAPIMSYAGSVRDGKAVAFSSSDQQSIYVLSPGTSTAEELIRTPLPSDPEAGESLSSLARIIGFVFILIGIICVGLPFLLSFLTRKKDTSTQHVTTDDEKEDTEQTVPHEKIEETPEPRYTPEDPEVTASSEAYLDGDMLYDIEKDLENIPSEVEIIRYERKKTDDNKDDLLPDLPDFDDDDDDIRPEKEIADIRNIPSFTGDTQIPKKSEDISHDDMPDLPELELDDDDDDEDDLPTLTRPDLEDNKEGDESDLPAPPPLNFDDEEEDESDLPAPPPLNFDDEEEDESDLPAPPPLNFDDEEQDESDLPTPQQQNKKEASPNVSDFDDDMIEALLEPDAAPITALSATKKVLSSSGSTEDTQSLDSHGRTPTPVTTTDEDDDDDFIPLGRMGDDTDRM